MKKIALFILAIIILPSAVLFSGCDLFDDYNDTNQNNTQTNNSDDNSNSGNNQNNDNSQVLAFSLLDDGTYGVGIGTATRLSTIVIPETYMGKEVTKIVENGFYNNQNLESIIISNNIKEIGNYAFYNCSSLTSITIPNSVKSIGLNAFKYCDSITQVNYQGTIEDWCKISFNDGYYANPLSYAHNLYINNQLVENIEIPNTITEIKNYTFYGMTCLKNITIPNSVISIGYDAFGGCSSLTNVTIGDGVTSIGDYAFYNCSSLTNVTIGDAVTSIGYQVFYGCSSLANITIPNSVTSIGSHAFSDCSSLNYNIKDNIKYLGNEINPYLVAMGVTDKALSTYNLDDNVKIIYENSFSYCSSLTSIVIPNSVISIGYYAFDGCGSLTRVDYLGTIEDWCKISFNGGNANPLSYAHNLYINNQLVENIKIPNTITEIKNDTFYGMTCLKNITIPNSVTSIGNGAFYGCSFLESITIPNSVTSIGNLAFQFEYREFLTKIYYLGTIEDWCKISFSKDAVSICNLYINNRLVENIEIPNTITEIKDYAFYGMIYLKSVTIPSSVTTIGVRAFAVCISLKQITLPNSIANIDYEAFRHCDSLNYNIKNNIKYLGNDTNPYLVAVGVTDDDFSTYVLDENVKCISGGVFEDCDLLTNITIPHGVVSIGTGAFNYCQSLTNIVIPDSVTSIGTAAFQCCSSLTSVIIGNSVTSIGDWAFAGCSSLTNITIPESVTSIGDYAFYNCSSLTSITISNSITSIGSHAFSDCSSLTSITIPESVTSIGSYAFYYCYSLTIYCKATSQQSSWDSNWNSSNRPVYWYSETQPTTTGNYWHYVNGVVTKW